MASPLPDELKVAREATITAGGGATGGLLRYLFNILVARLLGVEMLGYYALSNAVTQISGRLGGLGLDIGVVHYVSKMTAGKRGEAAIATVRRAIGLGLGASLLVMVLLIVMADTMALRWFHDTSGQLKILITVFAVTIPLGTVARIAAGASQGLKVLKHRALALQIFPTAALSIGLILLVGWYGPLVSIGGSFVLSQVVSSVAALYLLLRIFPIHRKPKAAAEPGLVRFSLPLVGASVVAMALSWSDLIMLGALKDAATAGLYHPALRTAGIFSVLAYSFGSILAPLISAHHAENRSEQISHLLKLTTRWSFIFLWPAFLFLTLYSAQVLLMFGVDFLPMTAPLKVIALGQLVLTLTAGAALLLTMTGHPRYALMNAIAALGTNIVINLALIPRYGVMGAAIATAIAAGLLTVLRLLEAWSLYRLHPFSWGMGKPFIAAVAAWAGCLLLNRLIFDASPVVILLSGAGLYLVVYTSGMLLLGLDDDDRSVLQAVARKMRPGSN